MYILQSKSSVEVLNLFLLLLSFLLALLLPFHIFLFSYAILGPLHYLSQIAWLHDKKYFLKNTIDQKLLWFLSLTTFAISVLPIGNISLMMMITFLMSLLLVLPIHSKYKVFFLVLMLVMSLFLKANLAITILFGILLSTLIHVFLFTLLFMWNGAIKSKSPISRLNAFLFFFSSISFFVIQKTNIIFIGDYIKNTYEETFIHLHEVWFLILNQPFNIDMVFTNPWSIALMQFIAFSYTYHYLNWFSKTSIIGWTNSARRYKYQILLLWIGSVLIYLYDYSIGISILAFLSLMHVLLEFPLDFKIMISLTKHYVKGLF